MKKIDIPTLLLGLYVGTSPVYWVPEVPIAYVSTAKYALFIISIAALMFSKSARFNVPPNQIFGLVGAVILIVGMSFGFIQSSPTNSLRYIFDIAIAFAVIYIYSNYVNSHGNVFLLLKVAVVIICAFCAVTIMAAVSDAVNWTSPFGDGRLNVRNAGFGGARTGWSLGVAFFLPVGFMWAASIWRKSRLQSVVLLIVIVSCIFGSQLVVGGRVGIFGSMSAGMMWSFLSRNKVPTIVAAAMSALLLLSALGIDPVLDYLRLSSLGQSDELMDLDGASSGRIEQYVAGVQMVLERPIFGYGLEYYSTEYAISAEGVHNVWLRLWLQGGIVAMLTVALFCAYAVRKAIVIYRRCGPAAGSGLLCKAAACILFSGVTMAMFEPAVIVGAFQLNAMWWVAAGIVSGLSFRAISTTPVGQWRSQAHWPNHYRLHRGRPRNG